MAAHAQVVRVQGGEPRKDKLQLLFALAREQDEDAALLFGPSSKVRSLVLTLTTI